MTSQPTYERQEYDEHVKEGVAVKDGGVVKDDGTILSYHEWLGKVIDIKDVSITDYSDGGIDSEYSEERWTVQIGEEKFIFERWFSTSGGGTEWRDAASARPLYADAPGDWVVLNTSDFPQLVNDGDDNSEVTLDGVIESLVTLATERYTVLYQERVQSVIKQIKQEVFPFVVR